MSKQFYKYLSKKLIGFFDSNLKKVGERYYLQLDDQEKVYEFYNVLKEDARAKKFTYKHEKGEPYETIYIDVDGIKLVVASTINTTSAYLVTIRNCSEKQEGDWKNTAIFILCGESIDSIRSGCKNLVNDGMPFNVKSISSNLNDEIEKSSLAKVNKEVSKFFVNKKLANLYNTSLWDYEDILGILNKGSVDKEDYNKIGIFIDKGLDTLTTSRQIEKRLNENYGLYEKVSDVQEYEDKEAALEKYFDGNGVSKLKKDDWKDVDFSEVKKSYENNKNIDKSLKYIEKVDTTLNYDRVYWEKEKSDTVPGRRKRQIIVFNNGSTQIVKLKFEFDQLVSKSFVAPDSKGYISTSGKTLIITLEPDPINTTFYKLIYNHNNQAKSKYEFNIVIVNIAEEYLESIKSKYEIKGDRIQVNNDGFGVEIGSGRAVREVDVNEADEEITIKSDEIIKISNSSAAWEGDSLKFILATDNTKVPITISEESSRSKPITSNRVWKNKREFEESFKWECNKIRIRTNEYHLEEKLRYTFEVEKQIIEECIVYGEVDIDGVKDKAITISEKLRNAYENIVEYYKDKNNIPSLSYINNELKELYNKYLSIFNCEIERIKADSPISYDLEKMNLLKIGTLKQGERTIMTPLAPLNIAYQLEVCNELRNEEVDYHILERLRPNNLLPFIYGDNDELFRPVHQKDNIEWVVYEKSEQVSIGETNAFMAKVVREKLEQFINHFKYLFSRSSKAPVKINLININNDREIVRGIFEYIKKQIFEGKREIIPVEIRIFNSDNKTSFDEFFSYGTVEKLEEAFNIKLSGNSNDYDKVDVIRLVLENIKYYKYGNSKEYAYSHISFYKVCDDDRYAKHRTSDMESGLSLDGILSTVSSNRDGNNYRTGFGSKNLLNKDKLLLRTALNLNNLASNLDNYGDNPYRKDTSIITKPLVLDDKVRENLYNVSHWVTFIEPNFGLEYFENSDHKENLIVIHYSDQYTKSDQYDTITVTNKSEQYINIIEEYLKTKNIEISKEEAYRIIKSFNSINGEWLLNLIANKSQFDREKLSIISAIKYGLAILNHKDIIWIPISLEEVLRVSSAVKLNKSDGIFTLKNLKQKGIHSDDLIFIGVNVKNINKLKLYYYPVEVKIGYNFENIVQKGKSQIDKTYKVIKDQLFQHTNNDGKKLFRNMFFRNFFIQLLISNEQKLSSNKLWKEKGFERIEDIKRLLLNDKYEVSFELEDYIGRGALISFKKDNHWRCVNIEDEKLIVELTEDDAYRGVKDEIQAIDNKIISGDSDIDINKLLYTQTIISKINFYNSKTEVAEKEIATIEKITIGEVASTDQSDFDETDTNKDRIETQQIDAKAEQMVTSETEVGNSTNDDIRVLLGEAEGSTKKIFWEFGNKCLSNRHLLITGKSGQGKTYFIQCALKELVSQGVSAVIIDYTEGFKSSQLEPEFKIFLGQRLEQFRVYKDRFPIDIFQKGKKELDDDFYVDEDNSDVAERFKSVIAAVYKDLGVQQLNCVYQAVIRGMEKHGGKLNLPAFGQELEEDTSNYAQTALSQLNLFIDKNPFEANGKFNWSMLDAEGGKVFIVQLTGFTKEIQKIITEMILWDLWNYKLRHGTKDRPFAVILDEAQNLNFKDDSPSTRILTEGRKFGWSAWFATQFLKGQMDKATISRLQNSGQKIYFAQTEEEASSMAASLSIENEERKNWTKTLINLEKGKCIAHGPIIDGEGEIVACKPVKIKITSLNER
ncbi:DNA phosphorothioation-dependent restriction protein DptH [Clostridium sp. CH2]|uniref:DNA phosphorothioation-dependent restriction protein DptH n=1 Tax=Clostridium sp. CH2 TaxID=2949990 RepID=UPI00207980CC|nr:DNA phosphorothioation-dependent restriction protein DptH [Clostridium sp. CH2]